MRVSPILTAFNAGELSPQLLGRVDLEKYAMGCATVENFIVRPHGGLQRRPGTYYLKEVKDSSKATRLIPFQYSTEQAYVIEMGDVYMRFLKDYAQLEVSGAAYEIVSSYAEADLFDVQYVQDADIMYLTHPSYPPYKLSRTGDTAWTLEVVEFTDGPYMDTNVPDDVGDNLCTDGDCELNTGWSAVGAPGTRERSSDQANTGSYSRKVIGAVDTGDKWGTFTTVTDTIYRVKFAVLSTKGQIKLVVRKGDNSGDIISETISGVPNNEWTEYERYYKETAGGANAFVSFITPASSSGVVWYVDSIEIYEVDTILLTPSATSGTGITLTASGDLFEAGHVGAYFRLMHDEEWGYVKITYVTDAKTATADVINPLNGTGPTAYWREGAWSIKNGYPRTATFYEQRLIMASSDAEPQTLWGSVAGNYEDMTPGPLDDDPFNYTLADREVNAIRWMASLSNVIVGTTGGEARIGQQSQTDPITPSNCKITFQSFFGSCPVPGVSIGNAILFWERAGHPENLGEKLRELSYKYDTDGYAGVDLTILAEHIARGGVSEMALQQYPYRILWCVRNDGLLIGLTYERDQDVVGWHRHPMDGLVDSVCVIPGDYQDDVYMIVERAVEGSVKRYIEVMEDYEWGDDQADCIFMDCALSYDGTEKTISGATAADPVVITATSHGFTNGNHIKITGVEGMTELNGLEVVVANKTDHTFECLGLDGTTFTAYTSGGIAKQMAILMSGMDHLEGEAVAVLTDGAVHPPVSVTSGYVALEWYCCKAQVGIPYDSTMKTMPLEGGSREGTTQGKQTRIHEVALRFHRTLGGKAGPDVDNLDTIGFRTSKDLYGNPPVLFSGDKDLPFPGDWESSAQVMVVQDQSLPMTLLALMPRYRTEDR